MIEQMALKQALDSCMRHSDALQEVLIDIDKERLQQKDAEKLTKQERRALDQFAYRYTRLQDDMGSRLFPALLRALGENIEPMSVIDRLNRLEQLELLPSASEWIKLRKIRNEFTHEYPESKEEHTEKLVMAFKSAGRLVEILAKFRGRSQLRPVVYSS